jgi:hypothetical protein
MVKIKLKMIKMTSWILINATSTNTNKYYANTEFQATGFVQPRYYLDSYLRMIMQVKKLSNCIMSSYRLTNSKLCK